MFKEAVQSGGQVAIFPLFKDKQESTGYNKVEKGVNDNYYRMLEVRNYWYSSSFWDKQETKRSADKGQLVGFPSHKREMAVFSDNKKMSSMRKPVKVKYSQWEANMGDFYIIDDTPDYSFSIKKEFKKIKKSKYILFTFLIGTIAVISLACSLLTKF